MLGLPRVHDDGPAAPARRANRYDRFELAGAFGDLGTLIPFVAAYVSVLGMDPVGVLFGFGIAKIVCGLYYRTPFPVQPMKASGAVATTHTAPVAVTPDMVAGAGLVTALVWLALGLSGMTRRIAGLVGRPVALGIILGLGLSFMLEGIRMMSRDWLVGGLALAATLVLLRSRRLPAMALLLAGGAILALFQDPALRLELAGIEARLHWPAWALGDIGWRDLMLGAVFLALPQLPLTLSNAVIAVTEENNTLFPDRPVTEKKVALSTGLMNLFGAAAGGVPMCHGAGGMAGHVAFGARSGGALVILGAILVLLALFLGHAVDVVFRLFPLAVLGVILFIAGSQLALGGLAARDFGRREQVVLLVTAAFCLWNIGIAFAAGLALHHAVKRNIVQF